MAAVAAAVNRDGTRTSASADELRLLASLSRGGSRVAAGRFGGRDAKMARIRQQEAAMAAAAEAKLGMSVPSGVAAANAGRGTTVATTGGDAVAAGAGGTAQGGSQRSDTTSEVKLSGSRGKKKRKAGSEGEPSAGSAKQAGKKKARKAAAAADEAAAAQQGAQQGAQQQQQQQQQQQPKKLRIVIEPVVAHVGPAWNFVPTPATGAH